MEREEIDLMIFWCAVGEVRELSERIASGGNSLLGIGMDGSGCRKLCYHPFFLSFF